MRRRGTTGDLTHGRPPDDGSPCRTRAAGEGAPGAVWYAAIRAYDDGRVFWVDSDRVKRETADEAHADIAAALAAAR